MGLVLPPIEAYQVQHLPIVKAYADKIGLVEVINQLVSTEMAIDPGTIVLGLILATWPSENEAVTSGKVAGTASFTLTSLLAFLAGSCR